MGRPWRIEYEGALYHILSRGNEQKDVFYDDKDRFLFLETIGEMSERHEMDVFAYVLMGNHYHILLRTNRPNLSKAVDPVVLLNEVARILDRDLNDFRQSQRISRSDKDDRDLLVFFLWKTGLLTNERIGHFVGLTYSSVSHIVRSIRKRLEHDRGLKEKFKKTYSQFKMDTISHH